jgi:hypothetical protein
MCNKLKKQQLSKTIGSSLGHGVGGDSQEGIFWILVFSDVNIVQHKSQEGLYPQQQQRCANIKSPAGIYLFCTTVKTGPKSVQLRSKIVPAVKEYGEGMYSSTHS